MQKLPAYELLNKPDLFIIDGAGTGFDPGSIVPAYAFRNSFEKYKIHVELPLIKKFMGMSKKTHIQKLLEEQIVLNQFKKEYEREPNIEDVNTLYEMFKQELYLTAAKTEEIPGVRDALRKLKEGMDMKIIMTTGYDGRMVEETIRKLPWLEEVLHGYVTSDIDELFGKVYMESNKKGRPYPYMIYHAMELAEVKSADSVLKVGDTLVDLQAADNAHVPGIGVLSGNIKDIKVFEENLDRKHLVLLNLVMVTNLIESGELPRVIRERSI